MLSLDDEMIFWTSYRYCIGRHTYVNSLAEYMAKKYWNLLSDNQKRRAAEDIRMCIADYLRMSPINMTYDWNIPQAERRGLEDLFDLMIEENIDREKFFSLKSIYFHKENSELKADIEYDAKPSNIVSYSIRFEDLIPWMRLAELFDIDNHKRIDFNCKVYTVVESYRTKFRQFSEDYYQEVPYEFEKCYIDVEELQKGNVVYVGRIEEEEK